MNTHSETQLPNCEVVGYRGEGRKQHVLSLCGGGAVSEYHFKIVYPIQGIL